MKTSLVSTNPQATDLQDHGIAVHSGACLNIRPWRDPENGRDYVYCSIISTSSLVVQIDVATGRSKYFPMPKPCEAPWGIEFTLEGHLLVTSHSGHLARLDPRTGKFWITADMKGNYPWIVSRGADGLFYIATSPQTRLFRYDAVTEKLEDLGPLESTQTYLRSVQGGADGYVYGSVGCTAAQVVAYHIATGKITKLLPKKEELAGFHHLTRGLGEKIYVHTLGGKVYRLEHGQAFLETALDESVFAVRLPDGRTITGLDPDAIRIGEGSKAKIISYTYKTSGANIFHVAEGPNQTVYGSTIMPLYLLRYTPATKKLENLGRGGPDNGEAYSFGHCDGKLYYANYHLGNLMVYDPAKPLHKDPPGGMKWKTNPQLVTNLGKGHCRPRAMCIDSQKRVWVGSFPEYGCYNGGLGCYDIKRKKYVNNPVVIPNQSIIALAADEGGDIIYGATSTGRGSGTEPVTKGAHLFAWDATRHKLLWKLVPVPDNANIQNLLYRDGKLYGTTGSKPFSFFRLDVKTRKMDYLVPTEISGAREQSVSFGPDGNIYGITWMVLFRWHPETGKIEELCRCLGEDAKDFSGGSLFHRGSIIIKGRYYFSCGQRLKSMRLPI